jgi:hypothetical protein
MRKSVHDFFFSQARLARIGSITNQLVWTEKANYCCWFGRTVLPAQDIGSPVHCPAKECLKSPRRTGMCLTSKQRALTSQLSKHLADVVAEVVHTNSQTGMVPVLVEQNDRRPELISPIRHVGR